MKNLEIRPSENLGDLLRVGESFDSFTDQIPTILFTVGEGADHQHIELSRENANKLCAWLKEWLDTH